MIQVHAETLEPIHVTNKYGLVVQLWKERTFREGKFPAKEGTGSMEKAIESRRITFEEENPGEEPPGNKDPQK